MHTIGEIYLEVTLMKTRHSVMQKTSITLGICSFCKCVGYLSRGKTGPSKDSFTLLSLLKGSHYTCYHI